MCSHFAVCNQHFKLGSIAMPQIGTMSVTITQDVLKMFAGMLAAAMNSYIQAHGPFTPHMFVCQRSAAALHDSLSVTNIIPQTPVMLFLQLADSTCQPHAAGPRIVQLTHKPSANVGIVLVKASNVAWLLIVIHNCLVVRTTGSHRCCCSCSSCAVCCQPRQHAACGCAQHLKTPRLAQYLT
jgi:hypothetical protein